MANRRLLLELEQTRKQINRSVINPEVQTLSLAELEPIVKMVARSRAAYVSELFELAKQPTPSKADVDRLRELRETFDELVSAANALETMIEREYVDVQGNLSPGTRELD